LPTLYQPTPVSPSVISNKLEFYIIYLYPAFAVAMATSTNTIRDIDTSASPHTRQNNIDIMSLSVRNLT